VFSGRANFTAPAQRLLVFPPALWFELYCKLVDQFEEARMKTVGAFQAKTQLSRLLDEVEHGEIVTITRHGAPVAVLSPAKHVRDRRTGDQILAEMKRIRAGITLGGIPIRELIEEGRR
jgi:prevent-host-death family protein